MQQCILQRKRPSTDKCVLHMPRRSRRFRCCKCETCAFPIVDIATWKLTSSTGIDTSGLGHRSQERGLAHVLALKERFTLVNELWFPILLRICACPNSLRVPLSSVRERLLPPFFDGDRLLNEKQCRKENQNNEVL